MSAAEKQTDVGLTPYSLRPLKSQDVPQATEIERDAFPTLFPPTSFPRELKNRMAKYLVAWRRADSEPEPSDSTENLRGDTPLSVSRLLEGARSLWSRRRSAWEPGQQYIVGFVGTWYLTDEAHIVSVGVRSELRGFGIGELLLIGAAEQAMERDADVMTLEVRVSNQLAQNLYKKYGFSVRGVRKAYYTDNREDAYIMTTDSVRDPSYREAFAELVERHAARWGRSERVLF
jgi:ribosomal-protein-alanine N-acetyltransferase